MVVLITNALGRKLQNTTHALTQKQKAFKHIHINTDNMIGTNRRIRMRVLKKESEVLDNKFWEMLSKKTIQNAWSNEDRIWDKFDGPGKD